MIDQRPIPSKASPTRHFNDDRSRSRNNPNRTQNKVYAKETREGGIRKEREKKKPSRSQVKLKEKTSYKGNVVSVMPIILVHAVLVRSLRYH